MTAQVEVLGAVKRLQEANLRAAIKALLPTGVTFEEVYAEVVHAVNRNPQIEDCTTASVIRAVGLAAKTGLIIGETVHLVPFEVNVKVSPRGAAREEWRKEYRLEKINDYKGDIELVTRSGAARSVMAKCVFQNEVERRFEYTEGTSTEIVHRPFLDPKDRGPLFGAYARAIISPTLPPTIVWMHISEIDVIRAASKTWRDSEKVKGCPHWYAKKTVIKQLGKFLSKNSKVASFLADTLDSEPIAVVEQEDVRYLPTAAAEQIDTDAVRGERVREVLNDRSGELRFQDDRDLVEEDRRR